MQTEQREQDLLLNHRLLVSARRLMDQEAFDIGDIGAALVALMTAEGWLDAWLHQNAVAFAREFCRDIRRTERPKARRRAFRLAAEATERGDAEAFDAFRLHYPTGGDRWVRAQALTREEHRDLATSYRRQGRTQLKIAAFHEAVARRLAAGQRTDSVFTPEEYDGLYARMVDGRREA